MKVQRSSMYAQFRKGVRLVSVAAVLSSFALGAACARKPGDTPITAANGEIAMETQLKNSFPDFDWKAKQNKELAARIEGASLNLSPVETKEKEVVRVGADLLVQIAGEANLLHATKEITSGKAVEMDMSAESNPAYSIQARCMDKTCDIVTALVTETSAVEDGLSHTSEEVDVSASGVDYLALMEKDAVKIKPVASTTATNLKNAADGVAVTGPAAPAQPAKDEASADKGAADTAASDAADAAKVDDSAAQADNKATDVEESSGASTNASGNAKQADAKTDAQPAAPAKEPAKEAAKAEDKKKVVRRVALVFRKRQVDPTLKPEAQKAVIEKEGNMELIFSSSPSEDFKAGKSKVGVKVKAPGVTIPAPAAPAAPAGEQAPGDGASTAVPAEANGTTVTDAGQQNGQPTVNTTKQTENLK